MINVRNAGFIELYAKNARAERGQEPPDASKRDLFAKSMGGRDNSGPYCSSRAFADKAICYEATKQAIP